MDSKSETIYAEGLQRLRSRRKLTIYLFFGWFLLIPVLVLLFLKVPSSAKYFGFVMIPYVVTFVVSAYISGYSECPRCKNNFYSFQASSTKHCQNCGLNINADLWKLSEVRLRIHNKPVELTACSFAVHRKVPADTTLIRAAAHFFVICFIKLNEYLKHELQKD